MRDRHRKYVGIKTSHFIAGKGKGSVGAKREPLVRAFSLYGLRRGHCEAHRLDGLPAGGEEPHSYPTKSLGQWVHYTGILLSVRWGGIRQRGNTGSRSDMCVESPMSQRKWEKGKHGSFFKKNHLGLSDSRWLDQFALVRNWSARVRKLLCGRV